MKLRLPAWSVPAGVCCACERTTRTRGARVCPYCGEQVLRSRRAGIVAWLTLAVPAATSVAALFSNGVRGTLATFPSGAGVAASGLAAIGAALPLFPLDETDLVVSNPRERRMWQAASFLGGLFAVFAAFMSAAALASAPAATRLLAAAALPFVLMIPFYWRVSFSLLLSPFLFYAAFQITSDGFR